MLDFTGEYVLKKTQEILNKLTKTRLVYHSLNISPTLRICLVNSRLKILPFKKIARLSISNFNKGGSRLLLFLMLRFYIFDYMN